MNVPLKIGGYLLGLGVVFAAAAGVGALTGPVGADPATVTDVSHTTGPGHGDMPSGNDDRPDDHSND
ncbi:hypothetical protein [Modestobacter sp. SSW1-42]|uniref:hypothetical protein n=1 Tax=Modestobacter sp. SSW1-42 TaxID=596372 RepID=UPI0039886973